ncbi:hypothetical protein CspHIS471_0700870 [Cutaneotrichosporon sp. HIS471]|nr:hypothetical protein CspHIS471_0700870 [Cutaneotrichosporon sp. HIS471]
MAPVATTSFARADDPGARKLELASDAADEINLRKLQDKDNAYDASQFDKNKDQAAFRQFVDENEGSKALYREQHTKQTVEFNVSARKRAFEKPRAVMGIWEAMEMLNTLIDASDPDTDATQIEHLLQTAEAMRADGKPRWMQVTGLIHDLGKLLYFFEPEGQWAVVGDTYVVGCKFPLDKIVYPDTFGECPDLNHLVYSTELGIYEKGCGLENLLITWGHDEYLYMVMKAQSSLPQSALNMIRYHSFYPWHREGAYRQFMGPGDEEALRDVLAFNPYDLYSKSDARPDVTKLKPYYEELIAEFFPDKIRW